MDRNEYIWEQFYTSIRRSLRGNVDRNISPVTIPPIATCRSLRGNVDRNRQALPVSVLLRRRSLRGNVDRNTKSSLKSGDLIVVVPYVGTWIEI